MSKKKGYSKNCKGYNVTLCFKSDCSDCIETMVFKSRLDMLAATRDAESRGCFAWQVTFLSCDP